MAAASLSRRLAVIAPPRAAAAVASHALSARHGLLVTPSRGRGLPLPLRRSFASSTGGGRDIDGNDVQPDYYAVLGLPRSATQEQIKAAFREQAKLYHPDIRASSTPSGAAAVDADAALDRFKLVNEAYSVLSDASLKAQFDAHTFSRRDMLRRRNEGWAGERAPTAVAEYRPFDSSKKGVYDSDAEFRESMARASAKYADGIKARASMARLNRPKIDIPTKRDSYLNLLAPVGVLGLWVAIYLVLV